MKVVFLVVGKVKERPLRAVLDDYLGRIQRYAKLEEIELKDVAASELIERFERRIDAQGRTVALEVEGATWSSEDLAKQVGHCELHSIPTLTFLIGGSYGLPPEVSKKADARFSLGRITLPHRLARVVLAEQVYRAFTILRGEPYSH
ncbi:MAG: 23S rRNA (pseudouridine(1915)-N(3))-methyltransferase RlmH [Sandaracinaceae bacterium]|nr:23S rRNA (pseudouridine(1915)-N(3))-methyltransferase RlmH [Sandaracinaceae bacterium]